MATASNPPSDQQLGGGAHERARRRSPFGVTAAVMVGHGASKPRPRWAFCGKRPRFPKPGLRVSDRRSGDGKMARMPNMSRRGALRLGGRGRRGGGRRRPRRTGRSAHRIRRPTSHACPARTSGPTHPTDDGHRIVRVGRARRREHQLGHRSPAGSDANAAPGDRPARQERHATAAGGVEQGLAQAVAAGLPPFAVVAVDGSYWHKRRPGRTPGAMVSTS